MKKKYCLILAVCAFLMNGCASEKSSTVATAEKSVAISSADVTDVCKILPKEEMEKIIGEPVSSAEPGKSGGGSNTPAVFSICNYELPGDRTISFFARRAEGRDNTPENIAEIRSVHGEQMKLETEDVSELGAGAFWTKTPLEIMKIKMYTLHAFKGENIYVYVTLKNPKSAAEAKAQAVKIAQAALAKF